MDLSKFDRYVLETMNEIKDLCSRVEHVFLYGAGSFGKNLFEYLSGLNIDIAGFLVSDGKPKPEQISGKPVHYVSQLPFEPNKCAVILSLENAYHPAVKKALAEFGVLRVYPDNGRDISALRSFVILKKLSSYLEFDFDGKYIIEKDCFRLPNFTRFPKETTIKNVEYITIMTSEMLLPALCGIDDYSGEGAAEYGKVKISPHDTVISCGAFIGHLPALAASRGCKVYALEPAPTIRSLLEETQALYPSLIEVLPYAVSDECGRQIFVESFADDVFCLKSAPHASIAGSGANQIDVETITIDKLVEQHGIKKVDYIRANIEDSERSMIAGASLTLKRFAPKLVVSTRHRPDNKEVLAEMILKANPRYKIEYRWMSLYAYVE